MLKNSIESEKIIYFIFLFAMILYLPGVFWELPIGEYRRYVAVDEAKLTDYVIRFPLSMFDQKDLRYPTFMQTVVGFFTLPTKALVLFGVSKNDFIKNFWLIYTVLGRLTVCGIALLIGLIFYVTLPNTMARMIAITITIFSPAFIEQSTIFLTNVPAALFFLLVAVVSVRIINASRKKAIFFTYLAVLMLGLGIGTKYPVAISGIMVILAFCLNPITRNIAFRNNLQLMIFCVLLVIASFTITTPSWIVCPECLFDSLFYERVRLFATKPSIGAFVQNIGFIKNVILTFGPFNLFLVFLGVLWGIRRIAQEQISGYYSKIVFVLSTGLIGYIILNGTALKGRYWVIVIPTIGFLAGLTQSENNFAKYPLIKNLMTSLFYFSAIWAFIAVFPNYFIDTRPTAAKWITQNIPKTSSIATANYNSVPSTNGDEFALEHTAVLPVSDSVIAVNKSTRILSRWDIPHDYLILSTIDSPAGGGWENVIFRSDFEDIQEYVEAPTECIQNAPSGWDMAQLYPVVTASQRLVWYQNWKPGVDLCQLILSLPRNAGSERNCYLLEKLFRYEPFFLPPVTRLFPPNIQILKYTCTHDYQNK